MKTFVKNYIGKGKQINGIDVVKVTIKLEDAIKFKYEKEGKEYITFEIAKLKEADKFERTHTVYVTTTEESQDENQKSLKRNPKKK